MTVKKGTSRYDKIVALKYLVMFKDRCESMIDLIKPFNEDGDDSIFLSNNVFHTFFTEPGILVGYYVWRTHGVGNNIVDAWMLFMDEYDGWADDCKRIAQNAKTIFEEELRSIKDELPMSEQVLVP